MTPLQTCVHESNLCWVPGDARAPPYITAFEGLFEAVLAAPGIDLEAKSGFGQSALEMLESHVSKVGEMIDGLDHLAGSSGCEWDEECDELYESEMMCYDLQLRMAKDLIKSLRAKQ